MGFKNDIFYNRVVTKILLFFLFSIVLLIFTTGCNINSPHTKIRSDSEELSYSKNLFAMDTYMDLKAYGENAKPAIEQAADYLYDLDSRLDVTDSKSEISQLNCRNTNIVSYDTFDLISEMITYSNSSGGSFDPTVYPLVRAWGFTTDEKRIPSQNEIALLLPHVGIEKLSIDHDSHSINFTDEKTEIDTGAIAKGYASQKILNIFKENDIHSAIVSLGGNVLAMGSKPDKTDWKVAISNPFDPEQTIGMISAHDKFIVTSGSYQRFFKKDGKTYHHILDPSTGRPVDNDLVSVTIVAENGTLADALSTSLFVKGLTASSDFWNSSEYAFDAVFITKNKDIYVTEGLNSNFTTKSKKITVLNKTF